VLTHNLVFFKYGLKLFMNLTLLSWVWHGKVMFRRRRHATCMSVTSSFFLLSSAVQHFSDKCSQKQTRCTILHGDKSQITAYSKGGYAISVEWFECSAEDTGGLAFKTWRWCCLLHQLS